MKILKDGSVKGDATMLEENINTFEFHTIRLPYTPLSLSKPLPKPGFKFLMSRLVFHGTITFGPISTSQSLNHRSMEMVNRTKILTKPLVTRPPPSHRLHCRFVLSSCS